MGLEKKKNRSVLGDNPLSQGIFSKTDSEKSNPILDPEKSIKENQEDIINNVEKRFLKKDQRESVNLRLPIELNDWLNDLLKKGRRRHGAKIPKEVWVQAALELFQTMPVNWEEVKDEEELASILKNLESSLKNLDSSL